MDKRVRLFIFFYCVQHFDFTDAYKRYFNINTEEVNSLLIWNRHAHEQPLNLCRIILGGMGKCWQQKDAGL